MYVTRNRGYFFLYIWWLSLLFRISSHRLHLAALHPPSKLLPSILSSFFSHYWIRINDVSNKDRWQTSKVFSLAAIVRRCPAKTVRTKAGNLSLSLIFFAGLSHPPMLLLTPPPPPTTTYAFTHQRFISNTVIQYLITKFKFRISLHYHNLLPPLTTSTFFEPRLNIWILYIMHRIPPVIYCVSLVLFSFRQTVQYALPGPLKVC